MDGPGDLRGPSSKPFLWCLSALLHLRRGPDHGLPFPPPTLPPSGHMTSDLGLYMDLLGTASGETLAPLGLVERWNSTNSDDDDAPRTTPDHLSAPPPLHPPVPPALCLSPSLSA
ncbi:unnamed protein product [Gadus morhua 'NCC']